MKKMKKSMFFSSILMIVILVVALSTSTFAWFTSSTQVLTEKTTMSSASSSVANITIGWDGTSKLSSIPFQDSNTGANGLYPMVPSSNFANLIADEEADDGFTITDVTFWTSPIQVGEDGNQFRNNATGATPWTPKEVLEGEGTPVTGAFFINNWNTVSTATIQISIEVNTVDGVTYATSLTESFRMAAFARNTAGNTGFSYLGTYAEAGSAYYSEGWEAGNKVAEVVTETITTTPTFTCTVPQAIGNQAGSTQIYLFAWFEGGLLVDSIANLPITFNLEINAIG